MNIPISRSYFDSIFIFFQISATAFELSSGSQMYQNFFGFYYFTVVLSALFLLREIINLTMSFCLLACWSLCPTHFAFCPFGHFSVCLSVCLFVCLSVCLFVCLSVCLFVCLSVCLCPWLPVMRSVCREFLELIAQGPAKYFKSGINYGSTPNVHCTVI